MISLFKGFNDLLRENDISVMTDWIEIKVLYKTD